MEHGQHKESTRTLTPNPALLITSLRDIGYSFVSAIADIIDNSIAAHAKNIHIISQWNDGKPFVAIVDDGDGMSENELVEAMRFGCRNPLDCRSESDLGRFGMGMKTASISQCRKLSVLSKKDGNVTVAIWDVDKIYDSELPEWELEVHKKIESTDLLATYQECLLKCQSGTIVFWEKMDRLSSQESSPKEQEKNHTHSLALLKEHLELTFHRFISPDEVGKKKTNFYLNGTKLDAFNPFNPNNLTTIDLTERVIHYKGEIISVQAYILPHHNKVSAHEYKKYEGAEGYLNSQGFYIYRNRRLIIKGTWFRLIRRSELTKLIRIRVDIPNTLDYAWRIDIKKSNAELPEAIKNDLKLIIEKIQEVGKNVYKHRGYKLKDKVQSPLWRRTEVDGQLSYSINRKNPLLEHLMLKLDDEQMNELDDYLSMLETNFPRDHFFADMGDSPEKMKQNEVDTILLFSLVDRLLASNQQMTEQELLQIEPFCKYPGQIKKYLKQKQEAKNEQES